MAVLSPTARRSRRFAATIPIRLQIEESGVEHSAFTVDLSILGARIRIPLTLASGQVVRVIPWGACGKSIPSRVVWVEATPSGESIAGLEFLKGPQV